MQINPNEIIWDEKPAGINPNDIVWDGEDQPAESVGLSRPDPETGEIPDLTLGRLGSQAYRGAAQGLADQAHGFIAEEREKDPMADERMFQATGLDKLSPVERGMLGPLVSEATTAKGSPLDEQEISDLRVAFKTNRSKEYIESLSNFAESLPKPLPGSSGIIEDAVGGVSRFGPGMALTAINAPVGTISMFNQLYGQKYNELAEGGVEHDTAREVALLTSAINTPLEQAGSLFQIGMLKRLFSSAGVKAGMGKRLRQFIGVLAANVSGEGLEEYLQQYPDEIANIYAANYDKSGKEIADEVLKQLPRIGEGAKQAAKVGAVGGLIMTGGVQAVGAPFNIADYRAEKKAERKIDQPETTPQYTQEDIDHKKQQIKSTLDSGQATPAQLREAVKALPEGHILIPAINQVLESESPTARPIDLTGPKPTGADFLARERNQEIINQFEAEQAQAEQTAELEAQAQAEAQRQAEKDYWERVAGDIRGQQLERQIGLNRERLGETRPTTLQQPVEDVSRETAPVPEKTDVALEGAGASIDVEAHKAATSPLNDLPEPTQAQKEAGNYKKAHIKVQGMDITIENPEGSERKGVSPDGKEWSTLMQSHYGYFKRTEGKDGDQIDTFVGPDIDSKAVYIVDQVDPKTGKFDEHKVMVGFKGLKAAGEGYLANYEEGWQGLGNITEMPIDEFKNWLAKGKQKKPVVPTDRRQKQLKSLRIKEKRAGEERRKDEIRRKKVSELLPEEKDIEIRTLREEARQDHRTPLLNQKAFEDDKREEDQTSPMAQIDLEKFKWYNDKTTPGTLPTGEVVKGAYPLGNDILKAFGGAINEALVETGIKDKTTGYRSGGDEFTIVGATPGELEAFTQSLEEKANKIKLDILGNNGVHYILNGLPFSQGIGEGYDNAIKDYKANKEDRTKHGLRLTGRSAKPATLFRAGERESGRDSESDRDQRTVKKGFRHKKSQPSKVRTIRGAIKALGGINFLNYKGELKDMPLNVKYLQNKKTGIPIDNLVDMLIEDNWLDPGTTVSDFLEALRIDYKTLLSRDRLTVDLSEKKEYQKSEAEKKFEKELTHEPKAPPEGKYIQMNAEDLPMGKKLTLLEGKSPDGWDIYQVTEKDPFSVTLKDGIEIELKPLDKVEVLKKDLPKKTAVHKPHISKTLSINETPINIRGKSSSGNWAVEYTVTSPFGETKTQVNREYFWRKAEATEWIDEQKAKLEKKDEVSVSETKPPEATELIKSETLPDISETKELPKEPVQAKQVAEKKAPVDMFGQPVPTDIFGEAIPETKKPKKKGFRKKEKRILSQAQKPLFGEDRIQIQPELPLGKKKEQYSVKTANEINRFAQDTETPLKEASKKVTDNPNFVKWFGESKVVDENGEPLVVYHGTNVKEDFSIFKPGGTTPFARGVGVHFAKDPAVTSAFSMGDYTLPSNYAINTSQPEQSWYKDAEGITRYDGIIVIQDYKEAGVVPYNKKEHGPLWKAERTKGKHLRIAKPRGRVLPVYLNIQNPLIVDNALSDIDDYVVAREVANIVFPKDKRLFVDSATLNIGFQKKEAGKMWDSLVAGKAYTFGTTKWESFKEFNDDYSAALNNANRERVAKILKNVGYDGIVYNNTSRNEVVGDSDPTAYIAFNPTQIKSIYNTGAFSPTDPDIRYATKTTFKDANISLKDIQALFKGQRVGIAPDGTIFVKTRLGRGVQIKSVETITPDEAAFEVGYSRMKASGELIAGKYQDGVITISKVGDKWTLAHESEHFLEDAGLINKNDQKALKFEIRRRAKKGKWKTLNPDDIGGKEDRAEFIAQELKKRTESRPTVQRVLQKIQDLIDAFVNLYKRTARGVVRSVESGKIFDKKGTPTTKVISSYEKTAQRWYSQMETVLEQKLPGKGTPESMKQAINAFAKKGEFKAEELEWSGVTDWLDEQSGKVTKQEVLTYLKENNVQIREVVKTDDVSQRFEKISDDLYRNPAGWEVSRQEPVDIGEAFAGAAGVEEWVIYDSEGEYVSEGHETPEDAFETMLDFGVASDAAPETTKFNRSDLIVPGGENYKEVLLTLPERKDREALNLKYSELQGKWADLDAKGIKALKEHGKDSPEFKAIADEQMEIDRQKKKIRDQVSKLNKKQYTGGHWEEPNVLAHMRLNERTDTEGGKVLFLEEIQSDWLQRGRQVGFGPKDRKARMKEIDNLMLAGKDKYGADEWIKKPEFKQLQDEYGKLYDNDFVPDAPFKKSWPMLIIKRAVRMAAEGGFDKLGWTPGEIQAARYDLSKQVDSIEYNPEYGGGELVATKGDEKLIHETEVAPEDLEKFIGKEPAKKLIDQIDAWESFYKGKPWQDKLANPPSIEGEDLKVGGEGMKSFYDKMLVNEVNKFFNKKKWGNAKVGVIKLGSEQEEWGVYGVDNFTKIFPTEAAATDWQEAVEEGVIEDPGEGYYLAATGKYSDTLEVWSLPITPEIKQKALREGMPMFSVKGEYQYERCCVDFAAGEVESLDKMIEDATDITYDTFIKHVGVGQMAEQWPIYDWGAQRGGLRLKDDWGVSFHKSKIDDRPVYYMVHSSIEYIYSKDAPMFSVKQHEQYSVKKPDLDPDIQDLLNNLMPEAKEGLSKLKEPTQKNIHKESKGLFKHAQDRFGKGFVDKDMKGYDRSFNNPYWSGKKFWFMKAVVNNEIDAAETRSTELFNDYDGDLGDLQDGFRKWSKAQKKEFQDLIWKWDGRRMPKKDVPTDWHKPIEHGEDIEINPEHYEEVRKFLIEQGVTSEVVDGFLTIRKKLDEKYVDIDSVMRIEQRDPTLIQEYRTDIKKAHNYFPHRRTGNAYIQIFDNENNVVFREHYNILKDRVLPINRKATGRAERWLREAIKKGDLKGQVSDYRIGEPGALKELPDEVFFQIPIENMQQVLAVAGRRLEDARVEYESERLYNKEGRTKKEALELAKKRLTADMEDALSKAVADTFKARGWGKHGIHRKNIPGHETEDVFGILFDYLSGYSGFKTKITRTKAHHKVLINLDAKKYPAGYKHLSKYVKDMLANQDRTDRAVDTLRGIFFVKYLGFVVKSGMVNLTQNVVMAAPMLGLHTKGAHRKLGKAMIDVRKALTAKNAWFGKEVKYKHLTEGEQQALHDMIESGASMDLFLRELKGNMPGVGMGRHFKKVIDKSGVFMQVAEKFNRASTGLAAYRVGIKEKGMTHDEAVALAKQVIYDSHFLYGKANMPTAMRGGDFQKIARAGYTFRSFSHNYILAMKHLFFNQPGGKKAFARSLRNLFLCGGLTSIPFFKVLSEALFWAIGEDDEDPLTKVRQAMPNEWTKDLIVYGLPGILGADFSGSLSIEVPRNYKDIIGVPYAAVEDSINMYKSLKSGNVYRAVSETPITPISVRNAMRGLELYKVGHRTRSGRDINAAGKVGPRKITGKEFAQKSLIGLQPTSVSKGFASYRATKKMQTSISEKRRSFADRFVNALKRDDQKAMQAVMAEIVKWNEKAAKARKPHRIIDIEGMIKSRLKPGFGNIPESMRWKAIEIQREWE